MCIKNLVRLSAQPVPSADARGQFVVANVVRDQTAPVVQDVESFPETKRCGFQARLANGISSHQNVL